MEQSFRKKPVVIQAVQVPEASDENYIEKMRWIQQWCGGPESEDGGIFIKTLEGVRHADPLDWIIRGMKGEFYPCKPDIFELTYERY